MKKAIIFITIVPLLILTTSCIRMGPPPAPVWNLEGPYVYVESINTSISKGKYTACYEDYVFYFDSAEKGIKALNTATDEDRLISSVNDVVSQIAVNDEYVFFTSDNTIYQMNYEGELIDNNNKFDVIEALVVLADTLYIKGRIKPNVYDSLYSLSANNIKTVPFDLEHDFDYDGDVGIKHIDEKNSVDITVSKAGISYTLLQDYFVIYGKWFMLDENDNAYFRMAYGSKEVLERTDGLQIEIPKQYEYHSIYKSNVPGKFVLLGQYFGTISYHMENPPMSYHESDVLLEIDIKNETAETLFETGKGERIIGYWMGKALSLKDEKISVFDPASKEKTEIFSFKKSSPNNDLSLCVLNGYLFVYEEAELILCEKLMW